MCLEVSHIYMTAAVGYEMCREPLEKKADLIMVNIMPNSNRAEFEALALLDCQIEIEIA